MCSLKAVIADQPLENHIHDSGRQQLVDPALDEPEPSPRELAVRFTDTKGYFVSEARVYWVLKWPDLITSPAFIMVKTTSAFKEKTAVPNRLRQTDFTDLKVTRWGWFYLFTELDDFSRQIRVWKFCPGMASWR